MTDTPLTPERVAERERDMLDNPGAAYGILRSLIADWNAGQTGTDHSKAHRLASLVYDTTGVNLHWNSAYYHAGAGTRGWTSMKLETGLALLKAIKADVTKGETE